MKYNQKIRDNKFKIGDRVNALITNEKSGDTIAYSGIIRSTKGVSVLVQFDHWPDEATFINHRLCVRLIKRKKPRL